nr:MAG TPA: hypothetical protein [Caudoviricetes sp.]
MDLLAFDTLLLTSIARLSIVLSGTFPLPFKNLYSKKEGTQCPLFNNCVINILL